MVKKMAVKKVIKKKSEGSDSKDGGKDYRVSDLEITDEFRTISNSANGK